MGRPQKPKKNQLPDKVISDPKEIKPKRPPSKLKETDKYALTEKQKIFVMEYCRDGNGKRAAMAAGVPEKSAAVIAHAWLTGNKNGVKGFYAHVRAAVIQGMADKRAECKIDAKEIVAELSKIAFFNVQELFTPEGELKPISELPSYITAGVKKIKVAKKLKLDDNQETVETTISEIEFWDKLEALKQLSTHLGLLKEYTLHNHVHLDWNALMGLKKPTKPDPIEQKILDLEAGVVHQLPDRQQSKEVLEQLPVNDVAKHIDEELDLSPTPKPIEVVEDPEVAKTPDTPPTPDQILKKLFGTGRLNHGEAGN